ncbi:MAG: hypothetical protein HYV28_01195 [Ignavibacteriales bacterium]|nr:hypothetical protein [Ignavibacteriales bacterium]
MDSFSLKMVLIVFTLQFSVTFSQNLQNLSQAKGALKHYYTTSYYSDVDSIIRLAYIKLENTPVPEKACAVFDVDETTLDNYQEIASLDFGYRADLWDNWIYTASAKAITPVKEFYDSLKIRGIHLIFVTGRETRHYEATKKNLESAGYTGFDTLIVKDGHGTYSSTGEYKKQIQHSLEQKGYKILICVGDQESDFNGFSGPIRVKLPNFIYLVD